MKIATKIIAGFGVLMVLMAGLVAYELYTIHRLQSVSRDLSGVNFRATLASLQLMRQRDLVEEYARKYFLAGDPQYRSALEEYQRQLENSLAEAAANVPARMEHGKVTRLSAEWQGFKTDLAAEESRLQPGTFAALPENLNRRLEQLRLELLDFYHESLTVIADEVQRSGATGRTAESAAWIVAALALLIGAAVTFFITRSISKPLRSLAEGTNRISAGQFDYRLDPSGSDELAQLARDFNLMSRRLHELDQMKKDFVSHVSHELKAPLSSMREALQLLLEELPGPLTPKQRRLLEINLNCSRRLSSMIGNLLDLSRVEAGMMEYELKSHDLGLLIRTVAAELDPRAGEKSIGLRLMLGPAPLMAYCDADRIQQVLSNVIGNAIKFSPPGKSVEIRATFQQDLPSQLPDAWRRSVTAAPGKAGWVLAEIADDGPGVLPADREKIFERFQQARQTKALSGQGVGLGLAISRTIMQAHQGAIWLEENQGGGSIFFILLPTAGNSEISHSVSGPI